jgi:hypothetical protein
LLVSMFLAIGFGDSSGRAAPRSNSELRWNQPEVRLRRREDLGPEKLSQCGFEDTRKWKRSPYDSGNLYRSANQAFHLQLPLHLRFPSISGCISTSDCISARGFPKSGRFRTKLIAVLDISHETSNLFAE